MDLLFKKYCWGGELKEEEYKKRLLKLKREKKMTGDDIKRTLLKFIGNRFLTVTERNHIGQNVNPFDLVVGEERSLRMIGFEIKGDTDNFTRLNQQLKAYTHVLEDIYIVLHKKKSPEWLPRHIGIIRVFGNGDVFEEKSCYTESYLDVGTHYEWDALFRRNGLSITSTKTRETLKIIFDVRRNILFNRFFAIHKGYNTKEFVRWYPFTEQQKSIIVGFDVPHHYKMLEKEVGHLEKRFEFLKKVLMVGQTGLEEFKSEEKKKVGGTGQSRIKKFGGKKKK